ncbi:MAG: hypothetical protein II690_06960 [Ruminococcus sp.]|nr:hypothetical protein [Ruminococcus sp.]
MEDKFTYTYSAARNAEVEQIRRKYIDLPANDDKLEKLRRLDHECERPGIVISILVGCIGTAMLILALLIITRSAALVPGIVLGLAAFAVMAAAVPVYRSITSSRRKKAAPEILRLSDEITRQK